jgi:hypothetical protein
MNENTSDMILDGELEFAAVDVESGNMLYKIPEESNYFDVVDKTKYFFYDQIKEFIVNKTNENKDKE